MQCFELTQLNVSVWVLAMIAVGFVVFGTVAYIIDEFTLGLDSSIAACGFSLFSFLTFALIMFKILF